MATIYKPVEKTEFVCACGCGRSRTGFKFSKYFQPYCRVVAFNARKKAKREAAARALQEGQPAA